MSNITDSNMTEATSAQITFIDMLTERVPSMVIGCGDNGSDSLFELLDPKSGVVVTFNLAKRVIVLTHKNDSYTFANERLGAKIKRKVEELRSAICLNAINKFTALLNGTPPESQYI